MGLLIAGSASAQFVDLGESMLFARVGFEDSWTRTTPKVDDERWSVMAPDREGRSLAIRDMGLPGAPEGGALRLLPGPDMEFTVLVPFQADLTLLNASDPALFLRRVGREWAVYLNGVLLRSEFVRSGSGYVERSLRDVVVPLDKRRLVRGENLLAFRLRGDPFEEATGFDGAGPNVIGSYRALASGASEYLDLMLIGVYAFFALYHCVLFALRPKDRGYLFFGAATLLIALYMSSRANVAAALIADTGLLRRVEHVSLFLALPALLAFLESLLRRKRSVFVVAVAALCAVVGFVGVNELSDLEGSLSEISDVTIPSLYQLETVAKQILVVKVVLRNLANPYMYDDRELAMDQFSQIEKARAIYGPAIAALDKKEMTPEEAGLWKSVKDKLPTTAAYTDRIVKEANVILGTVDPDARAAMSRALHEFVFGEGRLVLDDFRDSVNAIVVYSQEFYGRQKTAESIVIAKRATAMLFGVTIAAFVAALILGIVLGRSISRSLGKVVKALDRVAEGDLSERLDIKGNDEFKQVAAAVGSVQGIVETIIGETGRITDLIVAGRLTERADASAYKGKYHDLVSGINETIGAMVGFLESIPVPVMAIDKDFHIIFMNKAGAALGGTTGEQLVTARRQCSELFRTGDCKTENCACSKAMQLNGQAQSHTEARPGTHRLDIEYIGVPIHDRQGTVVGALEVVMDQTAVKTAQRKIEKVGAFQGVEIERLTRNLGKIAAGDLDCDFDLSEADEDTKDVRERFAAIRETLKVSVGAIHALVKDADMLAQAAVDGRLQARADAASHQGDFRKIVEGVNRTLDLVVDPVNETIAILKRMADGDLTAEMTGDFKGDFDVLKTAINDTLGSINDLLGQVTMAVEQVAAGSQQVSQASQALSQGATEQASSLEEITSSVTEISGQTRQNTENAVQMNGLAISARDSAEQGNAQMRELVSAMSDINRSAEQIRNIVKAIDDISFQINLLALNANVEAARAGKYGKGFAVVAEEVRNLAVRSAGSVQETTKMVDEAIANIGKGNGLVDVTAKQLQEIVGGSGKVASLSEEVSTAGKEQSQGLEQISTGLNQIDQVTQSNTASAEESASAAEELSSQSQQLKAMLAKFKLRARETKLTNEDVMRMLQTEMGRQGLASRAGITLRREPAPPPAQSAARRPTGKADRRLLNPADVIALDDDDFGKF